MEAARPVYFFRLAKCFRHNNECLFKVSIFGDVVLFGLSVVHWRGSSHENIYYELRLAGALLSRDS